MWFVARFPQGRTVGGCLLFGVVYLLFLFFFWLVAVGLLMCSLSLVWLCGSCVLCFLSQGSLGPASVVYYFVRLRWVHETLKLS